MKTASKRFLAGLALAAAAGTPAAQDAAKPAAPDTSQWECKFCTVPQGWSGEAALGGLRVSEDAFAFARHNGLEKGSHFGLEAEVRYARELDYANLYASDFGLPARSLEAEGGRQGTWRLRLRYADLPYFQSDSARSPFDGIGGNVLTLGHGATWAPAITTASMGNLAADLRDMKIDSRRRQIGVGLSWLPAQGWELGFSVRNETREGTKAMGSSFFLNSTWLVAPTDYTTREVEAWASLARAAWQIRFGYQVSTFDETNPGLTWDNPFTSLAPGATVGQLALPPGNRFHQALMQGAWQLSEATRASASLALGRMEQNETFLPATVNPLVGPVVLPRDSLQGSVDTTRADLKLVTALTPKWRLNAAYSRDARENRTPQASFAWVSTDETLNTARTNLPYSFTRDLFKVSADYRITPRTKGSVGLDRDVQDRSNQEVASTTENTLWAKYGLRARSGLDLTLDAGRAKRSGSGYQAVPQLSPADNPLLRKYNMADRDLERLGARASYPLLPALTLGLEYATTREDYSQSAVGLTAARRRSLALDAALQAGEDTSLNAWLSAERIRSGQSGAQAVNNAADWFAENDDRVNTAGFGIRHVFVKKKFDAGADFTRSRSTGRVAVDAGTAAPGFPELRTDLSRVKLHANWNFSASLALGAKIWRERYSSASWAIDGVLPATIPNVLTLGQTSPNYNVSVASLTLRYRF